MPPQAEERVNVEGGTLVVLCGIAGSGKSTFAHKHFPEDLIISSDELRARISGDPANQAVSGRAFAMLHALVERRLRRGLTTVVDSTALSQRVRARLLAQARKYRRKAMLICLDVSREQAIAADRHRSRVVGHAVIAVQHDQFRKALAEVRHEPWHRVLALPPDRRDAVEFEVCVGSFDLRAFSGPFDIVGDVHGCLNELLMLTEQLGYLRSEEGGWRHPQGRTLVFLGDLGDRGPSSGLVFSLALRAVDAGCALYTPGNHCNKLMRYLQGRKVQKSHGLAGTIEQIEALDKRQRGFAERIKRLIEDAPPYLWLDGGRLVVAHAGIKEHMVGRYNGEVQRMVLYGDITGEKNPDGTPVRLDWAQHHRGSAAVVYGHTPREDVRWVNNTINIDQGCVFGGSLTALRWPEREAVSVKALQTYYVRH